MKTFKVMVEGEPVTVNALPGPEDVDAFRAFLQSDCEFGLDVESTGIEGAGIFDSAARLRLVQFGSRDEAWVLDPTSDLQRAWIWYALDNKSLTFITHRNYDILWARKRFGIDLGSRGIDTFVAACFLDPGERQRHDLKSLCEKHVDGQLKEAEVNLHEEFKQIAKALGYPVRGKEDLDRWGFTNIDVENELYLLYGGLDALYVRRLWDVLSARISEQGMAFAKLHDKDQQIQRIANGIQWRGMQLDVEYTKKLLAEIEGEFDAAYDRAKAEMSKDWPRDDLEPNPRSPVRCQWFENHGVKFTVKTDKGQPEISKHTLPTLCRRYRRHQCGPVFEDIRTMQERQNLLNNLRGLLKAADPNGVIHPTINIIAAKTSRMSITDPAMQTFKKDDKRLRRCLIFRPGMLGVGADYDSQEVRIAYAYSGDKALGRIINQGLNMHSETAKSLYGEDYTPEQRRFAKVVDFEQFYGVGPKHLAEQLGVPYGEAKKMWLGWRKTYKGLIDWSQEQEFFDVVINRWGRRIVADPLRRYANGNYMIQSSGRDVLGDAIIELERVGLSDRIWLLIHDEIILEVPAEEAEEAAEMLSAAMHGELNGVELRASGEVVGTRWGGEE